MIISIDVETTGLDPFRHAMTEIALVAPDGDHLHLTLDAPSGTPWEAFPLAHTRVGKHTSEYDDLYDRVRPSTADLQISEWLQKVGATPGKVIALGWNVGSFDRQFIRRALPRLDGWLGYRHIDLTAIRLLISNSDTGGADWLADMKVATNAELGADGEHCALWDARAAQMFWEACTRMPYLPAWPIKRSALNSTIGEEE